MTQGIDHLGLTVSDLSASLAFFTDALGWEKFGENPDYPAAYITDGYGKITLWQRTGDRPQGFDRHNNLGLHHAALKVANAAELAELYARVENWPGVTVEFSPELSGKGPKEHFIIREPGGTRLEISYDPR